MWKKYTGLNRSSTGTQTQISSKFAPSLEFHTVFFFFLDRLQPISAIHSLLLLGALDCKYFWTSCIYLILSFNILFPDLRKFHYFANNSAFLSFNILYPYLRKNFITLWITVLSWVSIFYSQIFITLRITGLRGSKGGWGLKEGPNQGRSRPFWANWLSLAALAKALITLIDRDLLHVLRRSHVRHRDVSAGPCYVSGTGSCSRDELQGELEVRGTRDCLPAPCTPMSYLRLSMKSMRSLASSTWGSTAHHRQLRFIRSLRGAEQ